MKNASIKHIIAITAIILFSTQISFGHAWTNTKRWCLPDKYHSFAEIEFLALGQQAVYDQFGNFMGFQAFLTWAKDKSHNKLCKNCARASKYRSTFYPNIFFGPNGQLWISPWGGQTVNAFAEAHNGPNCNSRVAWSTNSSYMRAGSSWQNSTPDITYLDANPGSSDGTIENYSIDFQDNTNTVTIDNLNGYLEIESGSNYSSELRVWIFDDPNGIIDENVDIHNTGLPILYSAEVILNAGNLQMSNISDPSAIIQYSINGKDRVDISNLQLQAVLPPGTDMNNLSVVVYGHGGVNIPNGPLNKGAQNLIAQSDVKVYPNPSSTQVQISLPDSKMQFEKIEIYDLSGRLIQSVNDSGFHTTTFDIQSLSTGTYYLKIYFDNRSVTQKLIKQ